MQIDMRVMELLSSRICHDIISPVSAISNGVELIEDIGGSVVDEAMKLIGDSVGHASRRLRLFRMAYGRAGSEENLPARDVRQVVEQYMAGGKVKLDWPENAIGDGIVASKGALKVIINLIIVGEELLAYGGGISIRSSDDGKKCDIEVTGRNARMSEQIQSALEGNSTVEEITPRSVQSYVTGRFAACFGLILRHSSPAEDRVEFALSASADQVSDGDGKAVSMEPIASTASV